MRLRSTIGWPYHAPTMILTNLFKQLFGRRRKESVDESLDELLAAARSTFDAGDLDTASKAVNTALSVKADCGEALFYSGLIAFARNNHQDALAAFRKAAEQEPANENCQYQMALCHQALGDMPAAQGCCKTALAINPDFVNAYFLMSCIELPGPQYTEVLTAVHQSLKPATYLEIGVETGRTIILASPRTSAIGVDPMPQIRHALGSNVRLFPTTSDAFFGQHDVKTEFGGRHVELAFIDGMHHFDFALRDFAQVERHCNRNSIVLVHDCYPFDRRTAERDRATTFWSGDVWRLVIALKKYRPDLDIRTIATPPTGLALIRNLNPDSRELSDHMDEIVAEMMATDYSMLDHDKKGALNWFPNEWSKIEGLLKANAA